MSKHLLFVFLLILPFRITADDYCGVRNTTFQSGEVINYVVFYNVIGLYVHAGDASFVSGLEYYNNKPVYHITGTGNSNSSYDWIFKVRDKYETFIDTASLKPYRFIRNVDEGGYKKFENITFNHDAGLAITNQGVSKVPSCVQDVLSAIYYARNVDFNKYKPGDKIPFKMFLDNELYEMYIRYLGKEKIKTKYGKFNAIHFKPLLIKGTIFEGGENMNVWVSDDPNHIPLRIESPISVGSVKVDMMGYRNLRHPLSSLLGWR